MSALTYLASPEGDERVRWTRRATLIGCAALAWMTLYEHLHILPAAISMRWQFWAAVLLIAQDTLGHAGGALVPDSTFCIPFFRTGRGYQVWWTAHWLIVLALLLWPHLAGGHS